MDSPWRDTDARRLNFGYQAEQICRNCSFFATRGGLMGLGSLSVAPLASIVLIHGLKTLFVVQRGQGKDFCRGECYVYGLMDIGIEMYSDDIFLHFT